MFAADLKMNHLLHSPANCFVIFAAILASTTTISASDVSSEHVAVEYHVDQKEHDVNGSSGNDVDHHGGNHVPGVHVVHLQFYYVERPLILTLFLIAVVLIKIGQSCHVLLLSVLTPIFCRACFGEFLK